jgi:hypothetical protein
MLNKALQLLFRMRIKNPNALGIDLQPSRKKSRLREEEERRQKEEALKRIEDLEARLRERDYTIPTELGMTVIPGKPNSHHVDPIVRIAR